MSSARSRKRKGAVSLIAVARLFLHATSTASSEGEGGERAGVAGESIILCQG